MKTQVGIIGGGPSGMLLSLLLGLKGIDSIVLEKHSRAHVLARIRAGVLEQGFAELMRMAGCGARMDTQGETHAGIFIADNGEKHYVDLAGHTGGQSIIVYGQAELTRDLYDVRAQRNGTVIHNVADVKLHGLTTQTPFITYQDNAPGKADHNNRIECDYIIGADGFHGPSRKAIPRDILQEHERLYPFGWLGVLSQTKPVSPEVMYCKSIRGFALCSLRSQSLSRYYIQIPLTDRVEDWNDERFWAELKLRIPKEEAQRLETGPSIEKSNAPLRSFVAEPMRYGTLFLAGDAAHIVPPTGARGLSAAAGDIYYLYNALVVHYKDDNDTGLEKYSEKALARVWKAQRFSWWMTNMLHRFPDNTPYDDKLQQAELDYLFASDTAMRTLAETYVGAPF